MVREYRGFVQRDDTLGFHLMNAAERLFKGTPKRQAPPPVDGPLPGCLFPGATDPEGVPDKVRINCPLEEGRFAPPGQRASGDLLIAAYNMERGMAFDEQVDLFRTHPALCKADVLLLTELDRGCSRSGCRNVARDLAQALEMNFVYGVEYVELPRESDLPVNRVETTCEHGNAILSRFPLNNVQQLRHADSENWYGHPSQPRLGGCLTLCADVAWTGQTLRVCCVHFDSSPQSDDRRVSQAREVLGMVADHPGPVVIGGDMNTLLYTADVWLGTRLDPTVRTLRAAGFTDAHRHLPPRRRGTTDRSYGLRGVIDLMWVKGLTVAEAGVVDPSLAGRLSDHLPVWASVRV